MRNLNNLRVRFKEWNCKVEIHRYANKRLAIELVDEETYEPVAFATVNMPNDKIDDDEICIKHWSENEGMVTSLINAGIIYEPHRELKSGYVIVPVAKLKKEFYELL